MNKKTYIIPTIHSEHLILGGAIADIPTYGDTGSQIDGSQGLTKERDAYNNKYEDEDWGTISHSIW